MYVHVYVCICIYMCVCVDLIFIFEAVDSFYFRRREKCKAMRLKYHLSSPSLLFLLFAVVFTEAEGTFA